MLVDQSDLLFQCKYSLIALRTHRAGQRDFMCCRFW